MTDFGRGLQRGRGRLARKEDQGEGRLTEGEDLHGHGPHACPPVDVRGVREGARVADCEMLLRLRLRRRLVCHGSWKVLMMETIAVVVVLPLVW